MELPQGILRMLTLNLWQHYGVCSIGVLSSSKDLRYIVILVVHDR
jgi:hypothetical protein